MLPQLHRLPPANKEGHTIACFVVKPFGKNYHLLKEEIEIKTTKDRLFNSLFYFFSRGKLSCFDDLNLVFQPKNPMWMKTFFEFLQMRSTES